VLVDWATLYFKTGDGRNAGSLREAIATFPAAQPAHAALGGVLARRASCPRRSRAIRRAPIHHAHGAVCGTLHDLYLATGHRIEAQEQDMIDR